MLFFGTYQVLLTGPNQTASDPSVMKTLQGKGVRQRYLTFLADFIANEPSSDFFAERQFNRYFLSDPLLSQMFFEGGLALLLFQHYGCQCTYELEEKFQREKQYAPYQHPYASFMSAQKIWSLFAPDIQEHLSQFQQIADISTEASFQKRIDLYLAERRFPHQALSQILRYQSQEYPNLPIDPRLIREELSLFGYKNARDWFGSAFIECIARFIVHGASFAKEQGYYVSKEEALAELLVKSEKAYQRLQGISELPVKNGYELFQYYQKIHQIDEETLIKIEQDLLLFQRLLQEAGKVAMIDTQEFEQFFSQAREYATVEIFQMPPELRFQSAEELKLFERYLSLICERYQTSLELPETFDDISLIEQRAPGLVGKHYVVEIGQISKKSLQSKVTVKQTWDWEESDDHWETLQMQFPELRQQECKDKLSRQRYLEGLDTNKRALIDTFARLSIIDNHPEWIEEALQQAERKERTFFLSSKPTFSDLEGISDFIALKQLLEGEGTLSCYTQDGEIYYSMKVKETSSEKEVLLFAEAKALHALDLAEPFDCNRMIESIYHELGEEGSFVASLSPEERADHLAPYRFRSFLKGYEKTFSSRWQPMRREETISRSSPSFTSFDEVSRLDPSSFSSVKVQPKEGAYFYRLIDKKVDTTLPLETILKAQQLLFIEAKKHFTSYLIEHIEKREPILLSSHVPSC